MEERKRSGILSEQPADLLSGHGWRAVVAVLREAVLRLWNDEAMSLAGNIAFRAVLALFPFLIFASSLTAFIGDPGMADRLVTFLIAIVPTPLVDTLVTEVRAVLTEKRGGVASVGVLLTIWFAAGGVDSVRVGLNRAYDIKEQRLGFGDFRASSAGGYRWCLGVCCCRLSPSVGASRWLPCASPSAAIRTRAGDA